MRRFASDLADAFRTLLIVLSFSTVHAAGAPPDVRIENPEKLPFYAQKQNYSALVENLDTDVQIPNGTKVKYKDLPTATAPDLRVIFNKTNAEWKAGMSGDPWRDFTANDKADILTEGTFHCVPAAVAMIMQYYAQLPGGSHFGIADRSEAEYLNELANDLDTNDQNSDKNGGTDGHMGTLGEDIKLGINAFVKRRAGAFGARTSVEVGVYDRDVYKAKIDKSVPVVILAKEPGALMSHAVVGIGYHPKEDGTVNGLIIRDPASSALENSGVEEPSASSDLPGAMDRAYGFRTNLEGDFTISEFNPFGSPLEDAWMISFEIVPEPATSTLFAAGWAIVLGGARRQRRSLGRC